MEFEANNFHSASFCSLFSTQTFGTQLLLDAYKGGEAIGTGICVMILMKRRAGKLRLYLFHLSLALCVRLVL